MPIARIAWRPRNGAAPAATNPIDCEKDACGKESAKGHEPAGEGGKAIPTEGPYPSDGYRAAMLACAAIEIQE